MVQSAMVTQDNGGGDTDCRRGDTGSGDVTGGVTCGGGEPWPAGGLVTAALSCCGEWFSGLSSGGMLINGGRSLDGLRYLRFLRSDVSSPTTTYERGFPADSCMIPGFHTPPSCC